MAKSHSVSIASKAHSNTLNSPSVEASLVVETKGGYPRIPKLTLYLPENLKIDQILIQNPPQFRFKRDKFVYILDLIYSLPSKKKKSIENYSGFTPINKSILGSIIKDYRRYINYLKEQNIVEEDGYTNGVVSAGLRFKENFRSILKPVEITDWTLIKNITYLRNHHQDFTTTSQLDYLKNWFYGELEIDIKGATNYLMEEYRRDLENPEILYPHLRLNSRLYPIEKLYRDNQKLFFVDKTAGRLHTFITQLKSDLRKFIKFNGKTLCAVDICNSQPYLLQTLLCKNIYERNTMMDRIIQAHPLMEPDSSIIIMLGVLINNMAKEPDVLQFKDIVSSGRFYEEFGKILKENGEIPNIPDNEVKSAAKEITFSTLFSKNSSIRFVKSIQLFRQQFPNVYELIKYIKEGNHPTLAVVLQNLEADLVLHKTCKLISESNPEIPLFTLHDSIITTEENVEFVREKMVEVLTQFIGLAPTLKIERWE